MRTKQPTRNRREARSRALTLLCFAAMLLALATPARAQKNSNFFTVNLQANATESLSVTAAPALVNFTLVPTGGVSAGGVPVSITTSWVLQPGRTTVFLYGYFFSAPAALTDGAGDNIASARVLGSFNGGAFAAFNANSPFAAGSSLQLFSLRILGFNKNSQRTDNLGLEIDTTGQLLPAGIYSGLLVIQAQAI